MNFVDYVATQERKRRVRMICSSWPPTERAQQKRRRGSMVCGTVQRPIGSNVAITKSRVLKRISKNDSVLHKHVKWLKNLQEERRRVEERKEAEHKQQQERKRQFMEREAMKRAKAKANPRPEPTACAPAAPHCVSDTDDSSTVASSIASVTTESKRPKPAWCQSEAAHEESAEVAAMDEETNLLDFVNGLDYEQYNEDLELQTLMNKVQERIKTLKRENKKDETKLQTCIDSENAAQRAEALDTGPVVDFVPTDIEHDEGDADDTKSIADSVMSHSTLGSVHSKKSLHALVAKAKERIEMAPIDEEEGDVAVPPPVLSTVTDDDGQRIAETRALNKLAFKNRNPAL